MEYERVDSKTFLFNMDTTPEVCLTFCLNHFKGINDFLDLFNSDYRQKVDNFLINVSRNMSSYLTSNVSMIMYSQAQKIFELRVPRTNSFELLQVFADNDFKNKLMRAMFKLIV